MKLYPFGMGRYHVSLIGVNEVRVTKNNYQWAYFFMSEDSFLLHKNERAVFLIIQWEDIEKQEKF